MGSIDPNHNFLLWSDEEAGDFGVIPQTNRHDIQELPWFSDESLLKLVESYPRSRLRVFASGLDPTNRAGDWKPIDTEGASAAEIWRSVQIGHMWLNLQRIDSVDPRFRELGDHLYGEIAKRCPHFEPLFWNRAFLFVSSPKAMVYLHADAQPNILWHIRGNKRVWIYPAYDERVASLERIEEICAGGEDDIDYRPEFDRYAKVFSLGPGEALSWPARSPHRVENESSLNVSLSTFHETAEDYQKVTDHCADYYLRQKWGLTSRLSGGPIKRFVYKACGKAGWVKTRPTKEYYASFRIDPEAPLGIRPIPGGPVLTEHSRLAQSRKG